MDSAPRYCLTRSARSPRTSSRILARARPNSLAKDSEVRRARGLVDHDKNTLIANKVNMYEHRARDR